MDLVRRSGNAKAFRIYLSVTSCAAESHEVKIPELIFFKKEIIGPTRH